MRTIIAILSTILNCVIANSINIPTFELAGTQNSVQFHKENDKYDLWYRGERVYHNVFDSVPYGMKGNFFVFFMDGKAGIASPTQILCYPKYENAKIMSSFGDCQIYLVKFKENGMYGLADITGKVIEEPKYDEIYSNGSGFRGKYFLHCFKGDTIYIQTLKGNMVGKVPKKGKYYKAINKLENKWYKKCPKDERALIKEYEEDYVRVCEKFIGEKDKLTSPLVDDYEISTDIMSPNDKTVSQYGKIVRLYDGDKWGLFHPAFGVVAQCIYDSMTEFDENGYADVVEDGIMRRINLFGATYCNLYELASKKIDDDLMFSMAKKDPYNVWIRDYINFFVLAKHNGMYDEAVQGYEELKEFIDLAQVPVSDDDINGINIRQRRCREWKEESLRPMQESNDNQSLLDDFIGVLGQLNSLLGGQKEMNTTAESYSQSSYNAGNETTSASNNYKTMYYNWEKRAISAYDALNGHSISASKYTQNKKILREAQREMRSWRLKANNAGVSISVSRYENIQIKPL